MGDTGCPALHGQAAVGSGLLAARSPSAFLPSPPRKGKRSRTAGHLLSLRRCPLGWCKRNLRETLLLQKHSPSPCPSQPAPTLWEGSSLLPFSAAFRPSTNLSWRQALPVRASCPPGRLPPSSTRAALQPPCAELSACVQPRALGQPGDASPTRSRKGPKSHAASQKLLLYP